jgi:hypothetical protein
VPAWLGPAAKVPEFGAKGDATQYVFYRSIQRLLDERFIEEIMP